MDVWTLRVKIITAQVMKSCACKLSEEELE
jgi:hypothetical protein